MEQGRILGIDFGRKRVGIAVSDPTGIIANGLTTIHANTIWEFMDDYLSKETVSCFVVGYPRKLNNDPSDAITYINPFIHKLRKKYPSIPIELIDERFTSKIALQTMIDGGLKKKARRNKELIDTISATLILQSFLDRQASMKRK